MNTKPNNTPEIKPEIPKEESTDSFFKDEAPPTLEEGATASAPLAKAKKRKKLIAGVCSGVVVVVIAVVIGFSVLGSDQTRTIPDEDVPLSSLSSGTGSSANRSASSGTRASDTDSSTSEDPNASEGEQSQTPSGNNSPSNENTSGNSSGGDTNNGSNQVWVPGWDEQVWVDTSHWESVYVGENPIYETRDVCNSCGAILPPGGGVAHLRDNLSCIGYGSQYVEVGSTPLYEDQWVTSGYWSTVHHEGYWK